MKVIEGDLIKLALEGNFDVIAHGCNCFNKQKSGIAKQMVNTFETDMFNLEYDGLSGAIDKLGRIDYNEFEIVDNVATQIDNYHNRFKEASYMKVVNCYTQYRYGLNHPDGQYAPLDYTALTLCMKKINHIFAGQKLGLPYLIGCGLAGGDEDSVLHILKTELNNVDLYLVKLK